MTIGSILFSLRPFTVCLDPYYLLTNKHTFCQISTGNWSKRKLKEFVKNLFDAKLAPLSFILTWSSSAICHLVCSQCSMMSVHLKCLLRFFQWIRISKKEFVQKRSKCGERFASLWSAINAATEAYIAKVTFLQKLNRVKAKNSMNIIQLPPYSPDMSPADFFQFQTQITTSRHPFSVDTRHKEFAARTEVDSGKCV